MGDNYDEEDLWKEKRDKRKENIIYLIAGISILTFFVLTVAIVICEIFNWIYAYNNPDTTYIQLQLRFISEYKGYIIAWVISYIAYLILGKQVKEISARKRRKNRE